MAHFAELIVNPQTGLKNLVSRVIVVSNNDITDENGNESEELGKLFCNKLLGGEWIQTSYNASFRKNYAGPNFTYDAENDAFVPPKPFNSWILNPDTFIWDPPTPYPNDNKLYFWDDINQQWVLHNTMPIN